MSAARARIVFSPSKVSGDVNEVAFLEMVKPFPSSAMHMQNLLEEYLKATEMTVAWAWRTMLLTAS